MSFLAKELKRKHASKVTGVYPLQLPLWLSPQKKSLVGRGSRPGIAQLRRVKYQGERTWLKSPVLAYVMPSFHDR